LARPATLPLLSHFLGEKYMKKKLLLFTLTFSIISLFAAPPDLPRLPNVSQEEEALIYKYEVDGLLKDFFAPVFSQQQLKDYFMCKLNEEYYTNLFSVERMLERQNFEVLQTGDEIICYCRDLPAIIIKLYTPILNHCYEVKEDQHLISRIILRNRIQEEIDAHPERGDIRVAEKGTYVFPWANEIKPYMNTKPFVLLAQRIFPGPSSLEMLPQEKIDNIFRTGDPLDFVDYREPNFIVDSDEAIWFIDTTIIPLDASREYFSSFGMRMHPLHKKACNGTLSVGDVQEFYKEAFLKKISCHIS